MFEEEIRTATLFGISAQTIRVETSRSSGLSRTNIVGLPDAAVREAKDRVSAAFKNSGLAFPRGRVVINLAPAIVKKQGTHFDLPIAVSVLVAQGLIPQGALADSYFFGELSLRGNVTPVQGILAFTLCAKDAGAIRVFIPEENVTEAALVDGIDIIPVNRLGDLVDHLLGNSLLKPISERPPLTHNRKSSADFAHVRGQEAVKRGLEIAAAGGHNLLMSGVPGAGKTMLARALPTILPSLPHDEILEVTNIHSIAGELSPTTPFIIERPFRSPHHSSSAISIIGGGQWPKPGEVSLAHRGVLFLDELPEFPRHVLEHLRQPLEDGEVTIARAAGTFRFPARFMLVAAMNPCPCGYATDPLRECSCTPRRMIDYNKKISGPLLDRIDLYVNVERVDTEKLTSEKNAESSSIIRKRVEKARTIQKKRLSKHGLHTNSEINAALLRKVAKPDPDGEKLIKAAIEKFRLSARSYGRILKISRTIADLLGEETVNSSHISEALHFRPTETPV